MKKKNDNLIYLVAGAVVLGITALALVSKKKEDEKELSISKNLSDKDKEVIEAFYSQNMSVAEIAMHVNKSEKEVLDYIVAARLNIKEVHTVIKNEMVIMRGFMEKKIDKIIENERELLHKSLKDVALVRTDIKAPVRYIEENMVKFSNTFKDTLDLTEDVLKDMLSVHKELLAKLGKIDIEEIKEISNSYEESAIIIAEAATSSASKMAEVADKLSKLTILGGDKQ